MRVKRLLPSILLFASVASSHAGELRGNLARKLREREDDDDGEVHVLVGYHKAKAKECVKKLQNVTVKHEFDKYQTIAAVLPKSEVWHLVEDEDVDYIQEDQMMYPDGMGEIVPYGIMMSQNPNVANGATNGGGGGSNVDCSDDKVFKVAIIDSGMWVGRKSKIHAWWLHS